MKRMIITSSEKSADDFRIRLIARLRSSNQALCQDAADYLQNPNVAARQGWSDAYYHEVKDCINEVKSELQSEN